MKIEFSPYQLTPQKSRGAQFSSAAREGALLRVTFEDGKIGYADLAPLPQFGDGSLQENLKSFQGWSSMPLADRAITLARIDAEARARGESLLRGQKIPESHFLVGSTDELKSLEIPKGFRFLKVKLGTTSDLAGEVKDLEAWLGDAEKNQTIPHNLQLRLDFNSRANYDQIVELFGPWILPRLDFFEDPMPWDFQKWHILNEELGFSLALDFEERSLAGAEDLRGTFDVIVVKPARPVAAPLDLAQNWNKQIAVTSYMDHPLGQVAAAWQAAFWAREFPRAVRECGLLTHTLYSPNSYSERLSVEGARLKIEDSGFGFGFDDLLAGENWRVLET